MLSILNSLLFEERSDLPLSDEVYLRYYFENIRDLQSYISGKIRLIKQEDPQLYFICKLKQQLRIVTELGELQSYHKEWQGMFARKRRQVDRIRRQWRRKMQQIH